MSSHVFILTCNNLHRRIYVFFLNLSGPNKKDLLKEDELEDYLENVLDGNVSDLSDIDDFNAEDEDEAVTLNRMTVVDNEMYSNETDVENQVVEVSTVYK